MKYYKLFFTLVLISCASNIPDEGKMVSELNQRIEQLKKISDLVNNDLVNLSGGKPHIRQILPSCLQLSKIIATCFDTISGNPHINYDTLLLKTNRCHNEYQKYLDTLLNTTKKSEYRFYNNEYENIKKVTKEDFQVFKLKGVTNRFNYLLTLEGILLKHYETLRQIRYNILGHGCGFDRFSYQNIVIQNNENSTDIRFSLYFEYKKTWIPRSIKNIRTINDQDIKIIKHSIKHNELYVQTNKLPPGSYEAKISYVILDENSEVWPERILSFLFLIRDE